MVTRDEGAMVTREEGPRRPSAENDAPDCPLERLKGSAHRYAMPFEPVAIKDWEALDDTVKPRGGS